MAKKVKCDECRNMGGWASPVKIGDSNIDYAEHVLRVMKRCYVCQVTDKTKPLHHEQYCKHFEPITEEWERIKGISAIERNIAELEKLVNEYHKSKQEVD